MTSITQYNEQDVRELREILNGMLFSAGIEPTAGRVTDGDRVNLALLNSFLRTLSERVAGFVQRAEATQVERDQLVMQRAAVRDFLGTNFDSYSIIASNK